MNISVTPNNRISAIGATTIPTVDNPGRFLCDSGLLFEINSKVLHPLGLSLAVQLDDNDKTVSFNIYDYRNSEGGVAFSKEALEIGLSKLKKYMETYGNSTVSSKDIDVQD